VANLITAPNPVAAWVAASNFLVDKHEAFNLVIEIQHPLDFDLSEIRRLDGGRSKLGADAITNVVNTIFPQKTWDNSGGNRAVFYARYAKAFKVLHAKDPSSWGTYFSRMTAFGPKQHNQLEEIIEKLKTWKNNPHAALYLHISSRDLDSPRPLRAPCLQYIGFLCPNKNAISLLAVYRNHDFFNKALGNYLGLALLLSYVATATGRNADALTCHSAHAYFDSTKSTFKNLIALHS
jgi:hypothetical protein